MPDRKEVIVGFISAAVIFITLFITGVTIKNDPLLHQAMTFGILARQISSVYPFPIEQTGMFDRAEQSMMDLLDPFSFRMAGREFDNLLEESTGEYGGIGISVIARDTVLMIMSVHEEGPGYAAGLKTGDFIIAIDGHPVARDNPSVAINAIRGKPGTTLQLTVYRPMLNDTLPLRLTREIIKLEHVIYAGMTADSLAYIRMADFEAGATEQLKEAVAELEAKQPLGYIIDLGGNPGGYLDEAITAAGVFLDRGTLVVGTRGRSRWDSRTYETTSRPLTDKPLVIMTDRGTASAAEIFSGAIHGAGRGVVVGDTTFGKGLVQTIIGLPRHGALRLTTARYYFADGRFLNPPDSALTFTGLAPDVVFQEPGEATFRGMILSGFLLYDFIESQWEMLRQLPDDFDFPGTVVPILRQYAESRGLIYRSRMTAVLDETVQQQRLDQGAKEIIAALDRLRQISAAFDRAAYDRERDFLTFYLRRVTIERKSGRSAAYRQVIVPSRPDIRQATEILLVPGHYRQILQGALAQKHS